MSAQYFYLVDEAFGPALIKVCAYFPYPIKIWLNGHEYAKRAATVAGIGCPELDTRCASTNDAAGLQRICDMLGPGTIRLFCQRWWARRPLPLTETDWAAGYWWDISMRQVEVSRTIIFDALRHARGFFEACAPTISTSADRRRYRSSWVAGLLPLQPGATGPAYYGPGTRSPSTPTSGTRGSSPPAASPTGDQSPRRGLRLPGPYRRLKTWLKFQPPSAQAALGSSDVRDLWARYPRGTPASSRCSTIRQ